MRKGLLFLQPSSQASGGPCRGASVGGAWNLPTVVTQAIPAK